MGRVGHCDDFSPLWYSEGRGGNGIDMEFNLA